MYQRLTAGKANKHYVLFICLFYFFLLKNWVEQSIPVVGYGDELFSLIAVIIFFMDLYRQQFRLRIRRGGVRQISNNISIIRDDSKSYTYVSRFSNSSIT